MDDLIRTILNGQLFIVKPYRQVVYVHLTKILLMTVKRWKLGFQNEATLTRSTTVVMYHPRLKALSKIIHENRNLLYMNDEVKDTFTPRLMVSFRTSQKLSSYLVRAKLYPLERTLGSRKCSKKRCEVWKCSKFIYFSK